MMKIIEKQIVSIELYLYLYMKKYTQFILGE